MRTFDQASLEKALTQHDEAVRKDDDRVAKTGRKGVVTTHGPYVVKESVTDGLLGGFKDALAPDRHRSGYVNAHRLGVARVDTAKPLAYVRRDGRVFSIFEDVSSFPRLDHLAREQVPVVVGPILSNAGRDDPYDATYANPAVLARAGVPFAIMAADTSNTRNLPYQAAMAVAYGLDEDVAMAAMTSTTAEILGLADEVGSLAPGRRADVLVTDGSPLQMLTSVEHVVIGGRIVPLESKHTELYERYRKRLHEPGTASH